MAHFHYGQGPALFLDLLQWPDLLLAVFSPIFMSPTCDAYLLDNRLVSSRANNSRDSLTQLLRAWAARSVRDAERAVAIGDLVAATDLLSVAEKALGMAMSRAGIGGE